MPIDKKFQHFSVINFRIFCMNIRVLLNEVRTFNTQRKRMYAFKQLFITSFNLYFNLSCGILA